jgi:drug/metabolite transporter (DMT)-like permease
LALASAASWGAGDFAGGIATRLSSSVTAVLLAQLTGFLVALGLLVGSSEPMPGQGALLWAAAAGVSGSVGLGAFYLALSRGTMGLVAPLTALIAAAVPAIIGIAGGDDTGSLVLAGMGLALMAVVLISLPDRRFGSPALPTYHGSRAREWLLIVIGGLGFSGFFLCIDVSHAAGGAVWWPLMMVKLAGATSVGVVTLVLAASGRAPARRLGRAALVMAGLAGLGDLGGNLFFVLVSNVGELAVVVVISSLYPVSTALLARAFLHERLGRVRLAGVALAVGGVILIGLGSV